MCHNLLKTNALLCSAVAALLLYIYRLLALSLSLPPTIIINKTPQLQPLTTDSNALTNDFNALTNDFN